MFVLLADITSTAVNVTVDGGGGFMAQAALFAVIALFGAGGLAWTILAIARNYAEKIAAQASKARDDALREALEAKRKLDEARAAAAASEKKAANAEKLNEVLVTKVEQDTARLDRNAATATKEKIKAFAEEQQVGGLLKATVERLGFSSAAESEKKEA